MQALRQFDLNLLIIFEALISECHVSRAAEKVFLSQSAMSHALNRLREYCDDPLLVRTANGLQATPRALEMLPEVRRALQLIDRTLAKPEAFDAARSNRVFTIACTDYFEAVIFPGLFARLQQTAPGVRINVEMITDASSREKLENRSVDLVVGVDASHRFPKHLVTEDWLSEHLVCLAGQQNSRISDQLSLQEYLDINHVVFFDQVGDTANPVDSWLQNQQLSRHHSVRTTNYMAAARIVAQTGAIATLPYQMARLFCDLLPVRIVTPPANMPVIDMQILHHPLFDNDPGLVWLRETIKQYDGYLTSA